MELETIIWTRNRITSDTWGNRNRKKTCIRAYRKNRI